ncbi:MAG: hypothetical protein JRE23_12735 [Deltaproteobacteria bacterium]|nr:hypothetical protein [Deltaproteobacteria bacterium]
MTDALMTTGMQIILYGHTGSGKSTLLINMLERIRENYIRTICMENQSLDTLIRDAFDQLGSFYDAELNSSEKRKLSGSVASKYAGIKASIGAESLSETGVKQRRVLPPEITPQALGRFLGEAGCCWVLDDFDNTEECVKKELARMMKVYMDMSKDYPELKIVAIGTVDSAHKVVSYNKRLRHRVAEIEVPSLTDSEIAKIIQEGKRLLNFQLSPHVEANIIKYSSGLASICHRLCLNICLAAGIDRTSPQSTIIGQEELDVALRKYVREESATFDHELANALRVDERGKYDDCRLIVNALARHGLEGATHAQILDQIRQEQPQYPAENLARYLKELCSDERRSLLRFHHASARFVFANPFYRTWIQASAGRNTSDLAVFRELQASVFARLKVQLSKQSSSWS